tara:strand:- start:893 stop:1414 length:522 start_codon:yes stop_codon:yes gene_type:complete
MRIKVTDRKIQRLREERDIARGVLANMNMEGLTAADEAYANATEPLNEKLNAALIEAQSGARVRLIYPSLLQSGAEEAEGLLDSLEIPQKLRVGARFEMYEEEGRVANRYKYEFAISAAVLERGSNKAWFLVEAGRDHFSAGSTIRNKLHITPAARVHKLKTLNRELVEGVAA